MSIFEPNDESNLLFEPSQNLPNIKQICVEKYINYGDDGEKGMSNDDNDRRLKKIAYSRAKVTHLFYQSAKLHIHLA